MSTALSNFGPYVLLGELGAGAMGVVYQARHVLTNRTVALKVIRATGQTPAELARRFRVEAEVVAALEHPNIVPIYDVGEHEGQLFLSMKLVPGGTLAEALAQEKFTATRAAQLLARIAHAVEHAHQRGVLHRDLKPANILLDDSGAPHLTDFGLAKLRDGPHDLTLSTTALGTPAYMAPEIAERGARTATIAADIYSLGAVLYQMLTGRPPFIGDTPLRVLDQVRQETPPPPHALCPAIPRDLEIICLKCLQREPHHRYVSAAGLADDLDRFVRGEPIAAREPALSELLLAWVRRHRVVAGFGASLLASLILGLGATLWQWFRAERFLGESSAANTRLTGELLRHDLREVESLFEAESDAKGLQLLTRLTLDHPTLRLPVTRLFSALTQRTFLWPTTPPLVHGGGVVQGAFTPDSRYVLTASRDGWARLWEAGSGTFVFKVPHESARGRFSLGADGHHLVTLNTNGSAQVWQVPEGKLLWQVPSIASCAFSPDGNTLALAESTGQVGLWDLRHRRRFAALNCGETRPLLLLHPAGDLVITIGQIGQVWAVTMPNPSNTTTTPMTYPAPVATFAPGGTVVHAELSSSGNLLLTVSGQQVRIWNPRTAALIRSAEFNTIVNCATFSSDGHWMASANQGNRARIENALSGGQRLVSLIHPLPAVSARFSADARWLVSACEDGRARIWAAEHSQLYAQTIGPEEPLRDAFFSPNGQRLLTLSAGGTARLWTAPRPLADELPLGLASETGPFDLSANGDWLAGADTDFTVKVFSTSPGRNSTVVARHWTNLTALAFSPNELWLASADASGGVKVSNPIPSFDGGKPSNPPTLESPRSGMGSQALNGPVLRLQWSRDSSVLAIASASNVCLLAAGQTNPPVVLPGTRSAALDFSPDGTRLVVAGIEPQALMFDTRTGRLLLRSPAHPGPIACVRFSPDGRRVATGSDGNAVNVWDAATAQPLWATLRPGGDPTCLAFSPDSRVLLTGDDLGAVRLWNLDTGRLQSDLLRHRRPVLSAEFSPDGEWVVTSGRDRFVRLTDVDSALPGAELAQAVSQPFARFSRDGRRILVTPEGSPPRLLWVPSENLPEAAVVTAWAELALGQRLNDQGGWEDLSDGGLRARHRLVTAAHGSLLPPIQARFFRVRQSQR